MPEINIKVRDKCAEGEDVVICNNSDYTVVWDLDSEWEPYSTRTMRVNMADGTYQDVVFSGDTAALPWVRPTGAHDMYKTGEYMLQSDALWLCKRDTVYAPEEYAAAWEVVGNGS